jgi:hypothetical protein
MNEHGGNARGYLRLLAAFWLTFGLITTFVPKLMELFMTDDGKDAGTAFSDNVWLHDGLDILAVALLLFVLSTIPPTPKILRAAAVVALAPVVAIVYTLVATDFYTALFLVPAATSLAFAAYGLLLAQRRAAPAGVAAEPA